MVDELFLFPERTLTENFIGAHTQVAQTGIIIITIITLFLRNKLLQETLKDALMGNQELEKIKILKNDSARKTNQHEPITIHSDTSETLTLQLADLLFVQADDNYSTLVWKDASGTYKKLLRVNLKHLERQINNSFAIRCHRSYIVNVNAISTISGNANGYKLQILDTDQFIPVSRTKGKEVIEKIHQLRNVMELS